MLRSTYEWTLEKAGHRHAPRWLFGISFVESSFFPIPPDVLLGPMCLAKPHKAFHFALICTLSSVLGAICGYAIGMFLFDTIGKAILDFYGLTEEFASFAQRFNEQGWLIVLLAGFTPLPFKVITIAAGATAMPLYVLVIASVISRAARFFLVAALLWKFGQPMKDLIDRHFGLLTAVVGILGVGGFVVVRYLV